MLKIAPKVNKSTRKNMVPTLTQWKKWTNEALEEAMDVMERGQTFLRKINKFWQVPLTLLSNHLNGRTSLRLRKVGLKGVLTNEDNIVVA